MKNEEKIDYSLEKETKPLVVLRTDWAELEQDVIAENQRLRDAITKAVDILNSYHHVPALGKACDLLTNALKPNAQIIGGTPSAESDCCAMD